MHASRRGCIGRSIWTEGNNWTEEFIVHWSGHWASGIVPWGRRHWVGNWMRQWTDRICPRSFVPMFVAGPITRPGPRWHHWRTMSVIKVMGRAWGVVMGRRRRAWGVVIVHPSSRVSLLWSGLSRHGRWRRWGFVELVAACSWNVVLKRSMSSHVVVTFHFPHWVS